MDAPSHPIPIPPALTLSFELMAQIFEFCLPAHRRVRPSPKRAPLVLTQICRGWRDISLATPELWSSIVLKYSSGSLYNGIPTLFDDTEPTYDSTCDLVELWLSRAGQSHLSISLNSLDNNGFKLLPDQLLKTVASYLSRCARLELGLTYADLVRFNQMVEGMPPSSSLRSLSVRCLNLSQERYLPLARFIALAPNLTAICLRGRFYPAMWPELNLIPRSLTALEISQRPGKPLPEWMTEVFALCPTLVHFATYSHHTPRPGEPQVEAPPLKSLVLRGGAGVLHTLTIPTLEHLEVNLVYYESRPLQPFLSRSGCHLSSLTLTLGPNSTGDELMLSFAVIPTLTTLELLLYIEDSILYGSIFSALHRTDLLPHLRTLSITDTKCLAPCSPFLEILLARQDTPLASAELHLRQPHRQTPPDDPIWHGLEDLAAHGVRVRVTTPTAVWSNMPAIDDEDDFGYEFDLSGLSRIRPGAFSPF